MIDVSAAASNVLDKVVRGGVADLRPMPRSLVDRGPTGGSTGARDTTWQVIDSFLAAHRDQ